MLPGCNTTIYHSGNGIIDVFDVFLSFLLLLSRLIVDLLEPLELYRSMLGGPLMTSNMKQFLLLLSQLCKFAPCSMCPNIVIIFLCSLQSARAYYRYEAARNLSTKLCDHATLVASSGRLLPTTLLLILQYNSTTDSSSINSVILIIVQGSLRRP